MQEGSGQHGIEAPDVVVIGGGPAGSTVATLVAREGHDVVLLDREKFPRFRIGESLMPASYWTLKRLGMLDRMKRSRFTSKRSVQFYSKTGKPSVPFYFSEVDSHESSATWQVDRLEFDKMLLDNARTAGVQVREEANVKDVLFENGRATGVVVETPEGGRATIRAKVIVDATGQTSLIARKLGLKKTDPKLTHAALFTRYLGARRDDGIDEGATLILRTDQDRSWFWFIPLQDDMVSVGVVGSIDYLWKDRDGDTQVIYDEELSRCPALQERLEGATQLNEVRPIRDFSYVSDRIAGDGWVMAGDAFGFLDPIYSTGVFLALKSAELAADSIIEAFRAEDFSARSLGRHGDDYLAGLEAMRKLVYAYYHPSFSVARFVRDHPECREHVVNLLIGNVFRVDVDKLFETMGRVIELPEARQLAEVEDPN